MKNKYLLIILIAMVILTSMFVVHNLTQTSLSKIQNDVMSEEFSNTLDSYYSDNFNEFELEVYSADLNISALKTISLYNLCNSLENDISGLNETENIYLFNVEKSIYLNKQYIDETFLDKNRAVLRDFYYAGYVADVLNDTTFTNLVKEKYSIFDTNKENDKILKKLVEYYLYDKEIENDTYVYNQIELVANGEQLAIDYESINKLMEYIQYAIILDDGSYTDNLKKIYNKLILYSNERYIFFDMDAIFQNYVWIIRILENYLHESTSNDLFRTIFNQQKKVYKSVTYQMTTPYNFACFVTALAYQNKNISDNLYNNLKNMYEQIKNNVSDNDYASTYYLKYVANLLNIDYQLPAIDDNLIGTDYYALLLYDKEVKIQDFAKSDDDITAFLMGADVCEKNDEIKNELKNIDIFSFENINEFGMLLNVYICDMKKYGIIDSEIENKVIKYIEKSKGPFGYEVKGAYDFRTSVYYTNILYILDGGEDIGLR